MKEFLKNQENDYEAKPNFEDFVNNDHFRMKNNSVFLKNQKTLR